MENNDMQFAPMTKAQYNEEIKLLNTQKRFAADNLKKYRKSLTDVKYVLNQMKMKKDQIIIREPKQLKGQKSLF